MPDSFIHRIDGRRAFGRDPAGYHAARPAYPKWTFDFLRDRCGLSSGTAAFEIGAGTGTATRPLLEYGANPVLAIEPDERLAAYLRQTIPNTALTVVSAPFEESGLPDAGFDLGLSATAFHWLDEPSALVKIARLLRPGGWWAMLWNVFGDAGRPDPFHEATKDLLGPPRNPSAGSGGVPFALDTKARMAALDRAEAFHRMEYRISHWPLVLDPDQTVALYATYSNVAIRPDREDVLRELRRIARDDFHGVVTRNIVTIVYIARRRAP